MKNLTDYNDFKNKKTLTESVKEVVEQEVVAEQVEVTIEEGEVSEGAQLLDNTWKVRTRVEVPTTLINAFIKKVKDETTEDLRKKWSEQELAEELTKFVTSSYMTIENLPVTIVSNASSEPKAQAQEQMPSETQVQAPAAQGEAPAQAQNPVNVQIEPAQGAQTAAPAQGAQQVAQTVPQAQKPAQGAQEI